MVKKLAVLILAVGLVVSFGACKQKSAEKAPAPATAPAPGTPANPHGAAGGPGIMMPPGEMHVVVPDAVKSKFSGVKLIIEDKSANKMSEATVKLGSEFKIPNSSLTVKVADFLPDFKMDGSLITSSSAEPNNPAVRVVVTENGKEIFKGWLYSKFPAIHPFQHEKFGLTLKEGVKG